MFRQYIKAQIQCLIFMVCQLRIHINCIGVRSDSGQVYRELIHAIPHCSQRIDIFGSGGGLKIAKQLKVPMLGEIPINTEMVEMGDRGDLVALVGRDGLDINKAYQKVLDEIEKN